MSNPIIRNTSPRYFYIVHGFPSALFDTLEKAEDSADLQLASCIKFYRVFLAPSGAECIRYIYTTHRDNNCCVGNLRG